MKNLNQTKFNKKSINRLGKMLRICHQNQLIILNNLQAINIMIRSNFIVLIAFIELTILLLALKFYFTPKTLSSHCKSYKASSQELGNGTVVDCIACYQQENQIFGSSVFNSVAILIPLSLKYQGNFNSNEPIQFLPNKLKNPLKQEFLYTGAAYIREECQQFQCSALYQPNFSLNKISKSTDNLEWNTVESFNLKESQVLGLKFINSNFTRQKYNMLTGSLSNQPKQNSLALRFRYNLASDLDNQYQPVFLLYSNQNSILIRLLLLAPLLLSLHKILSSLFSQNHPTKYLIYVSFFSGILSQNLLIITALVAIYLTLGEMLGKRYLGFFLSLLYFIVAILQSYHFISILVLCFVTFIIVYLMFGLEEKNRENYQNMAAISIICFNIFMAFILSWSTLAVVSICQFLACFTPHLDQKREKSSYSGVINHELQEQQDMVVKIQRQLGHH